MQDNSKTQGGSKKKVLANVLLIVTTLLWGTSFIITKNLTQEVPIGEEYVAEIQAYEQKVLSTRE